MKLTKATLNQLVQEELQRVLNEQSPPTPKVGGGQTEASTAVMAALPKWKKKGFSAGDLRYHGKDPKTGQAVVKPFKQPKLFDPKKHGVERKLSKPSRRVPDYPRASGLTKGGKEALLNPHQLAGLRKSDPNEFLRQAKRHKNPTAEEAADYQYRKKRGFRMPSGKMEDPATPHDAPGSPGFYDALRTAAAGGNKKAQAELQRYGLKEEFKQIVQEELEAVLAETLTKAEKEKKAKLKDELDDLEHK